jgi:hypothetical protein
MLGERAFSGRFRRKGRRLVSKELLVPELGSDVKVGGSKGVGA